MSDQTSVKEISLKEIIHLLIEWWKYLKTQWFKILISGIIGGIIGFFYAWMQPVNYKAKLTFVVEEGKSGANSLGGLVSLAGQFGVDIGNTTGGGLLSGDNILLYFKSTSLAREVLLSNYDSKSTQSIADVYANVYRLKDGWAKNKKIGIVNFSPLSNGTVHTRLQDSLLQTMIEKILNSQFEVSKTDKKAGFIDVTAKMENENLAQLYCERIVKEAVDRYIAVKTQRQKNTVEKLQSRVDSVAKLLNYKTISGASLQTSTSTMDINPLYRTGALVATETTIRDKTMLATIFASATQNLELAKFTLSQETPVIEIVDRPLLPLKKEKTSKLKSGILLSLISGFIVIFSMILKKSIK